MSNTTTSADVRNDIKQLAQKIECLAQQVQTSVDQGKDLIGVANELVRNSSTFTFTLGEMYALEQAGVKRVRSSGGSSSPRNYHNVRDSLGRFTRV